MMLKKTLILVVVVLSSAAASAASKELLCSEGNSEFSQFRAVIDDSNYDPGSGLFDIETGTILDNYAQARVTCAGHRIEEVNCVGYWFNIPAYLVEITIREDNGVAQATYRTLTDGLDLKGGPWECKIVPRLHP